MSKYVQGQTALLAIAAAAEPLVGTWRSRFDPSAATGIPPHVTVLIPFLPAERLDPATLSALRELVSRHRAFEATFAALQRFPGVLYLAPDAPGPFRTLTEAVSARWPEAPPYGGQFDEIIPHLTIASGQSEELLDRIAHSLAPRLPLTVPISTVGLFVFDGHRWHHRLDLPLAP